MQLESKISAFVRTYIFSINYEENIKAAAEIMKEKKVGSLLVKKDNEYVGIITERDILYKVVAEGKDIIKTKVGEIMSSPLITIDYNSTVKEALEKFKIHNIRRLVVVDKGKIIGILTLRSIIGDIRSLDKETLEFETVKGVICAYCGMIFENEKDLSKHIDRIHIGAGVLEERRR